MLCSSTTDSVGHTGDSAVSPVTLQPTVSVAVYEKPQLKHVHVFLENVKVVYKEDHQMRGTLSPGAT